MLIILWMSYDGCLKGIRRLPEVCLECVWMVCRGCLCGGEQRLSIDVSSWCLKGKSGLVNSGLVKSALVKSGHVNFGEAKSRSSNDRSGHVGTCKVKSG